MKFHWPLIEAVNAGRTLFTAQAGQHLKYVSSSITLYWFTLSVDFSLLHGRIDLFLVIGQSEVQIKSFDQLMFSQPNVTNPLSALNIWISVWERRDFISCLKRRKGSYKHIKPKSKFKIKPHWKPLFLILQLFWQKNQTFWAKQKFHTKVFLMILLLG